MTPISAIDPELAYLLANSAADDPVDVALLLHNAADPIAMFTRLGLENDSTIQYSYIERARVLSVHASAQIIRQLVEQPEVEMASASHMDE
jgi:hypothetical protein